VAIVSGRPFRLRFGPEPPFVKGHIWQGCWVARSVVVVEVNGYEIEPGANLSRANTVGSEAAK